MPMPMDMTAAQLAWALDGMADFPGNTGGLSMLMEGCLAYTYLSPRAAEIDAAYRALGDAYYAYRRAERPGSEVDPQKAWGEAMLAARALGAELRQLGDYRIERCKRPSECGTCNMPLGEDRECRSTLGHTD